MAAGAAATCILLGNNGGQGVGDGGVLGPDGWDQEQKSGASSVSGWEEDVLKATGRARPPKERQDRGGGGGYLEGRGGARLRQRLTAALCSSLFLLVGFTFAHCRAWVAQQRNGSLTAQRKAWQGKELRNPRVKRSQQERLWFLYRVLLGHQMA